MKKQSINLKTHIGVAILAIGTTVLFLTTSCSKPVTEKQSIVVKEVTPPAPKNDTILNVTYENGQTNSGIDKLGVTNATAGDAAYMVNPADNGSNYAIAHKIVYGDAGYYSDGAYRSESDAVGEKKYQFFSGNERRYEFSVLLKDWTAWDASKEVYESNIFQLKLSDNASGTGVPLQIRITRNAIRLRYDLALSPNNVKDVLQNVIPYVNQWIHFRIDAKWADTPTGYTKIYMKLPGQSDYMKIDEKLNYRNYTSVNPASNVGYIKWGLYGGNQGLTRIVYHDNIRIIKLPLAEN